MKHFIIGMLAIVFIIGVSPVSEAATTPAKDIKPLGLGPIYP